ncbi:hypothetical protein WAJ11_21305, partial [Acinetobacter baumannii]
RDVAANYTFFSQHAGVLALKTQKQLETGLCEKQRHCNNMVELQKAIEELRKLPQRYGRYEKYYDGEHGLAFATDKFTNAFGSLFREF